MSLSLIIFLALRECCNDSLQECIEHLSRSLPTYSLLCYYVLGFCLFGACVEVPLKKDGPGLVFAQLLRSK